jgi:hypothetical protein
VGALRQAVAELDRVSEGRSIRAVGRAYQELAEISSQLAKAVERLDRATGMLGPCDQQAMPVYLKRDLRAAVRARPALRERGR